MEVRCFHLFNMLLTSHLLQIRDTYCLSRVSLCVRCSLRWFCVNEIWLDFKENVEHQHISKYLDFIPCYHIYNQEYIAFYNICIQLKSP